MRSSLVILAIALQAVVLPSLAQDTKQPAAYTVPAEHKEFVDQFKMLLKKFPKAEQRFQLADMGEPSPEKQRVILWKCREIIPGFVDCKPEIQ